MEWESMDPVIYLWGLILMAIGAFWGFVMGRS